MSSSFGIILKETIADGSIKHARCRVAGILGKFLRLLVVLPTREKAIVRLPALTGCLSVHAPCWPVPASAADTTFRRPFADTVFCLVCETGGKYSSVKTLCVFKFIIIEVRFF